MKRNDSRNRFYAELYSKIDSEDIKAEEFVALANANRNNSEKTSCDQFGFYELCAKFLDISLNAPKFQEPETQDVIAVFQYKDIDEAKSAFNEYVIKNNLEDIDGILEVIQIMHQYATADGDERIKHAFIANSNTVNNSNLGYVGKFHDFCSLTCEMWLTIYELIKK